MTRPRVLAPPSAHPPGDGRTPTFSIIVAAYQAADTIGDTLASAFAQTLPPREVVVCDDGSTDDLDGALRPFRDRITLLRQENRGEGAAKNAAARAASGDFVVILDADDVFDRRRLEALGELAVARPYLDVLTTNALLELEGGGFSAPTTRTSPSSPSTTSGTGSSATTPPCSGSPPSGGAGSPRSAASTRRCRRPRTGSSGSVWC